ncbi:hypothetical protein [Nocardioides euryhalodurans]|uniref:Uncharacterized protein n=1 Tax=Nocardioides euryhalodurans TaxID=2518370 RepID=A0A4P7GKH8_9ACTN|nr:hypothetical protein [Nocardioides euryhalodurans]QBR92181.1 hypothetical protein EXE57_07690 [Nocardioides euryhalodurans]
MVDTFGYWWADRVDGLHHRRRQWRHLVGRVGEGRASVRYVWAERLRRLRHPRWRRGRRPGRLTGPVTALGTWFAGLGSTVAGWFSRFGHGTTAWFSRVGHGTTGWLAGFGSALAGVGRWFSRLGHGTTGWFARVGHGTTGWVAARRTTAAGWVSDLPVKRLGIAAASLVVVAGLVTLATHLPDTSERADPGAEQVAAGPDREGRPVRNDRAQRLTGPGLTTAGIHLSVAPDEFGDLEVVERIITPEPITSLPLAAPPPVPDSEGPTARLVGLQVAADDSPVPVAWSGVVDQDRVLTLPQAATHLELRYRVVDADERSTSAPPGRATLSLRPAGSRALTSAPTVVEVHGAVVHTLVCVEAPKDRRLCGVDDPEGWHTEPVTAATSNVLALVDLPTPTR